MWKIIFQNLWSRRKRNGWIFAELVIVTMILWVLIDVSTVYLYNKSIKELVFYKIFSISYGNT